MTVQVLQKFLLLYFNIIVLVYTRDLDLKRKFRQFCLILGAVCGLYRGHKQNIHCRTELRQLWTHMTKRNTKFAMKKKKIQTNVRNAQPSGSCRHTQ